MKLFRIHLALPLIFAASAAAQGTAFNYQGHLSDGGNAVTGLYDLRFALYDAITNGSAAGTSVTQTAVDVRNGLFSTSLDFGPEVFTGSNRWLEISVRTNGRSIFTTLTPRQPLLPTPYAITAANLSGSLCATQLNGVLPSSALAGDYSAILNFNNESNHYVGDGTALKFGGFGYCALPCYWNLSGNAGTTPGQNFIGTTDNTPLEFRVNGRRALRLEPTTNSPNVIAGFEGNLIDGGAGGSTIGGGGTIDAPNLVEVTGSLGIAVPRFATIAGGLSNRISGASYATIAGGAANTIAEDRRSPSSFSDYNTIGGGGGNSINVTMRSTIAGGTGNQIQGDTGGRVYDSAIGGGAGNLIWCDELDSVEASTIAGGQNNRIRRTSHAVIGGGNGNFIGYSGDTATIGGGGGNSIGSRSSAATIAGGANNLTGTSSDGAAIGGGIGNSVSGFRIINATIAGGWSNTVTGVYGTIPGGINNAAADHAFAAGTRAKAVNSGSFVWADAEDEDFASTGTNQFLIRASGGVGIGTTTPQAALHVGGDLLVQGTSVRLEVNSLGAGLEPTATGQFSTALGNRCAATDISATALGNHTTASGQLSTAVGSYTTASGYISMAAGQDSRAGGYVSTALGNGTTANGRATTALGENTTAIDWASTALGSHTRASGRSSTAMGEGTISSGLASTAVGSNTIASGACSIAMGSSSVATNDNTFAGGTRARAEEPGSFVWASGNTNDFPSSTSNRVHFYAAGGLAVEYAGQDQYGRGLKWLVLASQEPGKVINVYNGAYLSEGGAWTDTSDRNAKENFEPVDSKEILERVTNLPLTSWSYRSESNSVRHLGPVAQDFHEAFGLGADDKHIAGLDSSGVALAAIQGLSQELKAKQKEINELKQRLEALERRLDTLPR